MQFTAPLVLSGKTATGLPVPESIVHALAGGKRPAVKVTINGFSYRSTIAPMASRSSGVSSVRSVASMS